MGAEVVKFPWNFPAISLEFCRHSAKERGMNSPLLHFPPFRLDPSNERLWDETHEIPLRRKTFAVLRYLVEHPEQLVTKEDLMNAVWPGTVVGDDALTGCVRDLRKVLGDEARTPHYIETVHGRGYRFIAALTTAPPVVSLQSSVVSQAEEGSIQEDEANQKSKGKSQKAKVEEQEIETEKAPFPDGELPSQSSVLSPQSFDSSALSPQPSPTSRFPRGFILGAVVLLVVSATVLYLASIRNPQSAIRNQEALPLPDKPSIIILPFTNLTGDPSQDYFSDGLTEVLTSDLSKISNLFVIARNSAFTYKGKAVQVQEVGREMGVRYVLESSVQRAGDLVRIAVQLIDAITGYHLWSERYDRPFTDIFAVQDEIVQQIVINLRVEVHEAEQERVRHLPTNNLNAYDSLLRGIGYASRLAKETNPQARQMFEQAIALDPQYAEAYTGLGWTYYWESVYQWSPDPRNVERAEELARQALALNDTLSGAHGLLSRVYWHKQQPELALASAEQAVALAPNYAEAHIWRARALMPVDRPAEALRDVEQAMRLNPRYPFWYPEDLAYAYRLLGRYEEAIAAHQQVLLRNPKYQFTYVFLVISYAEAWLSQQRQEPRTPEQALETAQRTVALNASSSLGHLALSLASLMNKHYAQAEAEVERSLALNPVIPDTYAVAAEILNWVGRPTEAIGLVEQALHLNPKPSSLYFLPLGHAYYLLGRTAEAIAPLQRILRVYPHRIDTHLLLAAAYSELGKNAEAQAEVAEVLRINPKFSLEVHRQRMPIKDPAVLERHIAALRKAGLK
jgi:TolB-like protein/DNA-binding winged helix-turn-helix (wHTH) protein/Flp pilus assembly protein TadD